MQRLYFVFESGNFLFQQMWLVMNWQSRTADEGWSSTLGVGRGANNPSL